MRLHIYMIPFMLCLGMAIDAMTAFHNPTQQSLMKAAIPCVNDTSSQKQNENQKQNDSTYAIHVSPNRIQKVALVAGTGYIAYHHPGKTLLGSIGLYLLRKTPPFSSIYNTVYNYVTYVFPELQSDTQETLNKLSQDVENLHKTAASKEQVRKMQKKLDKQSNQTSWLCENAARREDISRLEQTVQSLTKYAQESKNMFNTLGGWLRFTQS